MSERIKILRKALGLTQKKFAERLGVKPNTISQYESGRNDPIDAVISLICREFSVSEKWLRTGEGEMFVSSSDDPVARFAKEHGMTPLEESILREYVSLPSQYREIILDTAKRMVSALPATPKTDENIPEETKRIMEQSMLKLEKADKRA